MIAGLGIHSSNFGANCLFFAKKVSKWGMGSIREWFAHSLIFGKLPEWFAHNCSFLLSDLSESLTVTLLSWETWAIRSLRSEEMSKSFSSFFTVKTYKKYNFFRVFWSKSLIFWWAHKKRSNLLNKTEWFAHMLICTEQPAQIAHICSFDTGDLSNLLTVAH